MVAIATLVFAGQAAAESDRASFYAGLGLELFKLDYQGTNDAGTGYSLSSRPLALSLRLGWNVFDWLGVEGFVATGIHDDPNSGSFDVPNGDKVRTGKTELSLAYGVALKPRYAFNFNEGDTTIDVYGLVGYSGYEFEGNLVADNAFNQPPNKAHFTLDDNSLYYGAGLQIVGEPAALTLQYVQYADEDDYKIRAIQLGVIKFF